MRLSKVEWDCQVKVCVDHRWVSRELTVRAGSAQLAVKRAAFQVRTEPTFYGNRIAGVVVEAFRRKAVASPPAADERQASIFGT